MVYINILEYLAKPHHVRQKEIQRYLLEPIDQRQ